MGWIDTLKKAARGPARTDLDPQERARICGDLVQMSSLAAAVVTYAPLPFVDFVAITPIQVAMVMAVGRVYGRELDLKEARSILFELASVCGAGLVARQIFTTASKILLPGLGGLLAGPYAFAVTWAMGKTAMGYFDDPEGAKSRLKQIYEDAMGEGKRIFSRQAVEEFRRRRGKEVEDFTRKEAAREGKAAKRPSKPRARAKPAAPGKKPARAKKPQRRKSAEEPG